MIVKVFENWKHLRFLHAVDTDKKSRFKGQVWTLKFLKMIPEGTDKLLKMEYGFKCKIFKDFANKIVLAIFY